MDAFSFQILPLSPQQFVGGLVVVIMIHAILLTLPLLIYFERKISSYIQDRIGPNRVGFDFGLKPLQKLHWWLAGKNAKRPEVFHRKKAVP
ncbi:MAG: NADH-quinone oxidoreductase subunit H [Planctomycetota bacterium]